MVQGGTIWRVVVRLWGMCAVILVMAQVLGRALPPGDFIAFQRLLGNRAEIHLLDTNTHINQRIMGAEVYVDLIWVSDGQTLISQTKTGDLYQYTAQHTIHPADLPISQAMSGLAWSPDGCCIAYSTQNARGDGYEIQVLHLETGSRWGIVDSVVLSQTRPSWSPDSKKIAFMGYLINSGRSPRIYTVDVHTDDLALTTPPRRVPAVITDGFEGYANPVWSPDGTYIYFSRGMNGELTRVEVDGRIKTGDAFERVGDVYTHDPVSFSPDGTRMIYSSTVGTRQFQQFWLFIADPDGQQVQRMTYTRHFTQDINPAWRP